MTATAPLGGAAATEIEKTEGCNGTHKPDSISTQALPPCSPPRGGAAMTAWSACPDYDELKRMAQELKRPIDTLIALSAPNDPFFSGLPCNRACAEWFGTLWEQYGKGSARHIAASTIFCRRSRMAAS
jgi:hypothetical protein